MRLVWRIDALDQWRKEIEQRLGLLNSKVDGLTRADEIAEAVAQKMRQEHSLNLTIVQKGAATLFALATLTLAAHGWLW